MNDYLFYSNIHYQNDSVISSDFESVIPSKLGNVVATDKRSNCLEVQASSYAAPQKGLVVLKDFGQSTTTAEPTVPNLPTPNGRPWGAPEFMFYCTRPQSLILSTDSRHKQILKSLHPMIANMKIDPPNFRNDHGTNLVDWSQVGKLNSAPNKERISRWSSLISSGKPSKEIDKTTSTFRIN